MKNFKDIIEAAKMKGEDPCWKGYQMVGMKDKGGKKVPNCVPEEVQQEGAVPAQEKIITVKHKTSGKTLRISAGAAAKYRMQGYHYHPVNEAKDEQEYGYEGDMALNQLATLIRCGEMIKDLLKPDTDMPEWVQSKITLATDYIQTAADYLYSEMKEEVVQEGRPSQSHPLEGHDYHKKSNAELEYIAKDAHKAAEAMKSHNTTAENKYRDQANDSATVRHFRKTSGSPDWYKKKYGLKEEAEAIEELSNATLRGYADKARTDIQKTLPKLHTDAKAAGRIDKRVSGLAASSVAKVKNNMKKEDVEQVDEISQDLAGKYLEKVAHDQTKKDGMKPNMYGRLEPKRQKGVDRALDRLTVKEATDSDGGPPTEAAATLTVTGQPKLNKTIGQTKLIPYVQEDAETDKKGSWKVETPWRKVKGDGTVTDKSGAKHTPMSRARDLARQAIKRKMEEQSNIKPNPFTIPSKNPGKADKPESNYVKARNAGSSTKNAQARAAGAANPHMFESRQLEIVREAMKVAKKKKEVTEAGTDKFIADPDLTSQITKSNP